MSATLTMTMVEYTTMQTNLAEAREDAARLRAELVTAKLVDPSDRVAALTAFARDCLLIARFGVANLPPEMIRRWPYEELRRVANSIGVLPDCSFADRDMAIDLIAFAKDCEEHEIRRRAEPAPTKLTAADVEEQRQRLAASPVAAILEAKQISR